MTPKDAVKEFSRAFADADYYEFEARCLWFLSGYAPHMGLREAHDIVSEVRDESFTERILKHE